MVVLGINEDHNASAALLVDGRAVACASEERFIRIKNDVGYPREAIAYVMQQAGVGGRDLDQVVYGAVQQDPVDMKIKRTTRFRVKDYLREMYDYWKPVLLEKRPSTFWDEVQKEPRFSDPTGVHYDFRFMESLPREEWPQAFRHERQVTAAKQLGISPDKVGFVDHHTAHANYAYFAAPYERSRRTAVVTADSWGDGCNSSISIGHGESLTEVHRTSRNELARIYRFMTLLLGMKPNEHEYKVMGMAPYCHPGARGRAYEIFRETLVVDGMDFAWNRKPADLFFHFKAQFEREGIRFDAVAGGLQLWFEEMMQQWMGNIARELDTDTVVFGGGLALNVKANKTIAELPQIARFFVPAGAGDESLCLGAAITVAKDKDRIEPMHHCYLGPEPTEAEVRDAIREFGGGERFQIVEHPDARRIAEYLAGGSISGRCCGRMEFGARSLGNRSILCAPSRWADVRRINEKIKSRDFWMPFAPSILGERAADYVVTPTHLRASFMTLAYDTTSLAHEHLAATIHPYDMTVRPHFVDREVNPAYHALIAAFEKLTGIGAVLNTSFNLHGEPIVCTARDALHTLVKSGLDGVCLPGALVLKRAAQ